MNSTNTTTTASLSNEWPEESLLLMRIAYGYILLTICLLGIVGNVLNVLVMMQGQFKARIYFYAKLMALSDLCTMSLLVVYCMRYGFNVELCLSRAAAFYFAHIELVLLNGFLVSSSLLVLVICTERYVSVSYPLKTHQWLTKKRSRIAAIVVYVTAFVFCAPFALEYKVVVARTEIGNETVFVCYPDLFNEDVVNNVFYNSVYKWLRATILKFVPIVVVVALSIKTVVAYRKSERNRLVLSKGVDGKKAEQDGQRLIVMLLCVASIYVFCVTPSAILLLLDSAEFRNLFFFEVIIQAAPRP